MLLKCEIIEYKKAQQHCNVI